MEQGALNKEIVEGVKNWWEKEKRPILLSQLGALSGGDVARSARKFSLSLSHYIETQLCERITLLRHSIRPVIVGAVPSLIANGIANVDEILEQSVGRKTTTAGAHAVRFLPAFWFAFRKPLEEGKRRYLRTDGSRLEFLDLGEMETQLDGDVEIESDFIAKTRETPYTETHEKIQQWADKNGASFLHYTQPQFTNLARKDEIGRKNLLAMLFTSLAEKDLSRISVPLDIALKLARTPL
jgi:hypothetical protein